MSNTIIQLKKGTFKDIDLTGYQFVMIKACINAGYVTVDGSTANPPNPDIPARAIRVICGTPQNYNTIGEAEADTATTVSGTFADDSTVAHLSDNEIVERIRARFSALEHVTQAVKDGVLFELKLASNRVWVGIDDKQGYLVCKAISGKELPATMSQAH